MRIIRIALRPQSLSQRREVYPEYTATMPANFSSQITSGKAGGLSGERPKGADKTVRHPRRQLHSSPFKGEARRGMGFNEYDALPLPHPRPNPPLEGEGVYG